MELSWFSYTNFSHLPSWFVWCTVCSQIFFLSSPFPKLHFIYFFIFFFIFWYQPFASLLLLVLFHPSNLISLLFATLFPALPALLLTSWLNQFSKCVTAVWVWTMWQRTCLRGSISFPEASLSSAHHSQTILAPVPGGPTLQTELHPHSLSPWRIYSPNTAIKGSARHYCSCITVLWAESLIQTL